MTLPLARFWIDLESLLGNIIGVVLVILGLALVCLLTDAKRTRRERKRPRSKHWMDR